MFQIGSRQYLEICWLPKYFSHFYRHRNPKMKWQSRTLGERRKQDEVAEQKEETMFHREVRNLPQEFWARDQQTPLFFIKLTKKDEKKQRDALMTPLWCCTTKSVNIHDKGIQIYYWFLFQLSKKSSTLNRIHLTSYF